MRLNSESAWAKMPEVTVYTSIDRLTRNIQIGDMWVCGFNTRYIAIEGEEGIEVKKISDLVDQLGVPVFLDAVFAYL